ncbi:MAG: hypothetical protein AAGD32_00640 [Planctomycetota bacterium]
MKRWIRRILLVVAVLGLFAVGGIGAVWWALGNEPDWYAEALERNRTSAASPDSAIINAASAVNQAHRARTADDAITLTLSEAQLNGALQGKSTFDVAKALTDRLEAPVIELTEGRITLAGRAVKLDRVVSITAEVAVEDDLLVGEIVSLRGGRLPLPKTLLDQYREPGLRELRRKMPRWVRDAELQPNDLANDAAAAAVHGKVAQALLDEAPVDAVLMLPVDEGRSGWMPVRIESIEITEQAVTVVMRKLPVQQRVELIESLTQ